MASSSPPTYAGFAALGQRLTAHLQTQAYWPDLRVDCVEYGGRLLVVGQHPEPEVEDPKALLQALELALVEVMPTLGLADLPWAEAEAVPIRIYLKLKSTRQPYAMHTLTWRVADAASIVFPPGTEATEGSDTWPAQLPTAEEGLWEEEHSRSDDDAALALPATDIQPPEPALWSQSGLKVGQFLWDYWSYGVAALILLTSGLFAYALTRPCVVGSCDRLDQAAEFNTLAEATLAANPSRDDLTVAQADFQAAIDLLAPIPRWSSHYAIAQADLQGYQNRLTSLNALIQAQALAAQAANLSQNPPHPVERWVEIHLFWQRAIDQLTTIPADSPAFDYAQKKLSEYRVNHNTIGRRIVAEEEAEANFNTAIQTGQLAQQRMETANSLAGWQLATKEWQAAIKGLSLIPRGTMVYAEAQDQLKAYQTQLARSMNRANLEDISARSYDQAIQAAQQAAAYEAKGQWTLAVGQWQQAVASVQQIPADTILSKDGGQLLDTYRSALTSAQNRLRTAVALQGLTTTLGEMCANDSTPCTVREDPNQIQVVLTSQYAEPLRQAITPPAADGTFAFTNQLSPNVKQLLDQIITFSHQVNRQVALYDNRGGFIARYRPDLGGFIKN